jgi:arylsulfatase A-like enzyme
MSRLILTLIALIALLPDSSAVGAQRPNIVFIFVDDMGYGDLGCFRALRAKERAADADDAHYPPTPNIDQLAADGLRITQFYSASPICSPSRVGVTTGQYPSRHLINSYLNSREQNRERGMRDYLDPKVPTIARTFKKAGYSTAHFGKWHMGGGRDVDDAPLPQAYGFDESLVSFEGLGDRILPPGGLSDQSEKLGQGKITRVEKHEQTGIYVDRSLQFIERNKAKPFYLHLWLNDVHDRHAPAPGEAEKFADVARDDAERRFFAVLTEMDRQIGRLVKRIDELGLGEKTLIILTSDNGPTAWPSYDQQGLSAPGSTAGFRGRKWSLYEGGIRMPFIARWTKTIKPGSVNDKTVLAAVDLFPTLVAIAGIDLTKSLAEQGVGASPSRYFDGVDLSDAFRGEEPRRTTPLYWEYGRDDSYLQPAHPIDRSPNVALRDGDWKLLINDDGSWLELYNFSKSADEFENVAGKHPGIARKLAEQALTWRRSLPKLETIEDGQTTDDDRIVQDVEPGTSLDAADSPKLASVGVTVHAEITIPSEQSQLNGVIVAQGGSRAGYSLYLKDGKLHFTTRVRGQESTISGDPPPAGERTPIIAELERDGRITLKVGGTVVASGKAGSTIPNEPGDGLDVGRDRTSPVGPYQAPFAWNGTIHAVQVAVDKPSAQRSGHLVTRWARDVDPERPLPEYPRPQLQRERWLNLNGYWQYAVAPTDKVEQYPAAEVSLEGVPQKWDGRIVVPFCVESMLSGVQKRVGEDNCLWYRRGFTLPEDWAGQSIKLHFGAVDWDATVWVDGTMLGRHRGGYDPFSFDITPALKAGAPEHEILVRVWDPSDSGSQPRGKQVREPRGIWYTPVTGIWQTVWLEPVPAAHILGVTVTPDIDAGAARLQIRVAGEGAKKLKAEVLSGKESAASQEWDVPAAEDGVSTLDAQIPLADAHLWTPDDPHLYSLKLTLQGENAATVDAVDSYFGMRKIELGAGPQGRPRMLLNGEPLFQYGPLDQGWWPDGLYTAPTDEALKYDIEVTKQLGFNMARKHVKVEPARWYYWCDKLGLLVWQDMPSGMARDRDQHVGRGQKEDAKFSLEESEQFKIELQAMIDALRNHPSIVVWVPFNEGWGQHDTNDILKWTKEYDPSRLVGGPSGWEDRGYGDMKDMHLYPGPGMFPVMEDRASVLGEFGGLGLPVIGHTWVTQNNWGYRTYATKEELAENYERLVRQIPLLIGSGLAAAVYTQTTDVEIEVNGLLTYDRQLIKIDPKKLAEWHAPLYGPPPNYEVVLETSEDAPQTWRYTFEKPADDAWLQPEFDDAQWKSGEAGFGTRETPNTQVRTEWNTRDIWLRKSFEVKEVPKGAHLVLRIFHDEDAEVYLNGQKAASVRGYTTSYVDVPVEGGELKPGTNILAVHCHQTEGGQYIDLGLFAWMPGETKSE